MKTVSSGRVQLSVGEAMELADGALRRIGYGAEEAGVVADHVVDAALCGYEYSGLPKILNIAESPRLRAPRRAIRALHETPVSVQFDGGNNVGMFASFRATEAAVAKALRHGFAIVGINNIWQAGRIAHYATLAARCGLVCIYSVSTARMVAPPGAAEPALGTNPITFAFPTMNEPFVVDMGTAAFMGSDLAFHERIGKPLPEGVAIDAQGRPTREAGLVKALLPFGGHKGFALAMAMQAMGVLAGSQNDVEKSYGHLIITIKPDLLQPLDDYRRAMSAMLQRIKGTVRQPGVEEIRLPSERSSRERSRRLKEGIEIDEKIHDALVSLPQSRLPDLLPP